MSTIEWLTVLAVLICLLISAFFSASETALSASSRAAMLRLEHQGNRDAAIVNRLWATRERLLGAILFANNFTNIAASTLATGLLLTYFGHAGEIYAAFIMTFLIFIFAEVLPKTAAFNAPDRMALLVAQPVERTVRWFSPFLRIVEAMVRWMLRGLGMPTGKIHSILSPDEELRGAVDLMHSAGTVGKQDRDMMGGLLDLRELAVYDVMVHRTKMVMLDADEPPNEIIDAVLAAGVTRFRSGARGPITSSACSTPRKYGGRCMRRKAMSKRSTLKRWPCRPGSCPTRCRSPSSSRRSVIARRRSRSWSTSMASSKAW